MRFTVLRRLDQLLRLTLHASDGSIGRVHDLYFDDHQWTIRYVVADTRRWLPGRLVLIPPMSVQHIDWSRRRLDVDLTKAEIRHSPDIHTDKPVSRQHEVELHEYFALTPYWVGHPGGLAPFPVATRVPDPSEPGLSRRASREPESDPHLRSTRFVVGLTITGSDVEIGHVEDFLFDEQSWAIRYMVVDTSKWWPGKRVLVSPTWIAWISWLELNVRVDLPGAIIRNAPPYEPTRAFTPEDERVLLSYYAHSAHGAASGRADERQT